MGTGVTPCGALGTVWAAWDRSQHCKADALSAVPPLVISTHQAVSFGVTHPLIDSAAGGLYLPVSYSSAFSALPFPGPEILRRENVSGPAAGLREAPVGGCSSSVSRQPGLPLVVVCCP